MAGEQTVYRSWINDERLANHRFFIPRVGDRVLLITIEDGRRVTYRGSLGVRINGNDGYVVDTESKRSHRVTFDRVGLNLFLLDLPADASADARTQREERLQADRREAVSWLATQRVPIEQKEQSEDQAAVVALERSGKDEKEIPPPSAAAMDQPDLFSRKRKRDDSDEPHPFDLFMANERKHRLATLRQELNATQALEQEQKRTEEKLLQTLRADTVTECQQCMLPYSRGGGEDERRLPYPIRGCPETQHYLCFRCLEQWGQKHGFQNPPLPNGDPKRPVGHQSVARGIPYTCNQCGERPGQLPIDNTVFRFDRDPPLNRDVPTGLRVSDEDIKRFEALIPDEKTSLQRQREYTSHDAEMRAVSSRVQELKQEIEATERGETKERKPAKPVTVQVQRIEDLSLYQSHPISYSPADVLYDAVFVPLVPSDTSYRYYNEDASQWGEYVTATIESMASNGDEVYEHATFSSITMSRSATDAVPGHPRYTFIELRDPVTGVRPRPNRNANIRAMEEFEAAGRAFVVGDYFYSGATDDEAKDGDIGEIVKVEGGLVFFREADNRDTGTVAISENWFRSRLDEGKITFVARVKQLLQDATAARTLYLNPDGEGKRRSISLRRLFPLVHSQQFWTPLPGQPVWMWSGRSNRDSAVIAPRETSLLADVIEVIWEPAGSRPSTRTSEGKVVETPGDFTVRVRERIKGKVHEFRQNNTDIPRISMEYIAPPLTRAELTRVVGGAEHWIELREPVVTVFYSNLPTGDRIYEYIESFERKNGIVISVNLLRWGSTSSRRYFSAFNGLCTIVDRVPLAPGVRFRWSRLETQEGDRPHMPETFSVLRITRLDAAAQVVYFTETTGVFAGQEYHYPLHEFQRIAVIVPPEMVDAVEASGAAHNERLRKKEEERLERFKKEHEEKMRHQAAHSAAVANGFAPDVVFRWRSGPLQGNGVFVVSRSPVQRGQFGFYHLVLDRSYPIDHELKASLDDWKLVEILPTPPLVYGSIFRFMPPRLGAIGYGYYQSRGSEVTDNGTVGVFVDLVEPERDLRLPQDDFRVWVLPDVASDQVMHEWKLQNEQEEKERKRAEENKARNQAALDAASPPLDINDLYDDEPGSRIVFDDEREPERGLSQLSQPGAPPSSPVPPVPEPVPSPLRAVPLSPPELQAVRPRMVLSDWVRVGQRVFYITPDAGPRQGTIDSINPIVHAIRFDMHIAETDAVVRVTTRLPNGFIIIHAIPVWRDHHWIPEVDQNVWYINATEHRFEAHVVTRVERLISADSRRRLRVDFKQRFGAMRPSQVFVPILPGQLVYGLNHEEWQPMELKEYKEEKEGKEREVKVAEPSPHPGSGSGSHGRGSNDEDVHPAPMQALQLPPAQAPAPALAVSVVQDKPRRGDVFQWQGRERSSPLLLVTNVSETTFDVVLLFFEDDPSDAPLTVRRPLSEWSDAVRVPTPAPAHNVWFRWAPWSADGLDRNTYRITDIAENIMSYRRFGSQELRQRPFDRDLIVTFPPGY